MRSSRPRAILPADTVAVVAPSGPAEPAQVAAGMAVLARLGYVPRLVAPEGSGQPYLAGSDESRVRALEHAFADPDVAAIWCVRGGYGAARTAERLDLELVRRHPKPLIGFSDATALLLAVAPLGFHGPVVTQLPRLDEASLTHLVDMLAGRAQAIPLAPDRVVLSPGVADGMLVGGNLSVLCSLIGTPILPDLGGTLLFLEDVGEPVYRLDRMLTQLRMAGVLAGVRGLVFGQFTEIKDPRGLDELLGEAASWIRGPAVRGLPCGHGTANVTLPVGCLARLDTAADHLVLLEPAVLV